MLKSGLLLWYSKVYLKNYSLKFHSDEYVKTQEVKETIEDTSLLLPIQLMLQPLQKRFVFHFMSKKPTNRPDKVSFK